jgi:hypothetical protein
MTISEVELLVFDENSRNNSSASHLSSIHLILLVNWGQDSHLIFKANTVCSQSQKKINECEQKLTTGMQREAKYLAE